MVIWDYETVEIFYQNKKIQTRQCKNFRFGFKKRKEKAHEKLICFFSVLMFSLCFSSVAMAEYQENPGADKILVNKEKE